MIKIYLLLLVLFTSSVRSKEFTHAAGIGLQYAGIAGYQLAYTNDKHRFRTALGLIGASVGYDYLLTPHWSSGVTYTETLRSVYSVNINYYPQNPNHGLRFGIDLVHMPEDNEGEGFFHSEGSKNAVWLSVGYAF